MHSCAHASLGSTLLGNPKAFRASPCNAVRAPVSRRRVGVVAKIDTGYKKQADSDGQKSTVEDQLHEAELNKNAKSFVKEFKEDLGATGENKTKEDKKEIKQRDEDNLGLGRQKQDFDREQESKEIGKELNT